MADYGFNDMSIRELTDWLGGGHADVGSTTYEHAKAVLDTKRHERTQRVAVAGIAVAAVVAIVLALW